MEGTTAELTGDEQRVSGGASGSHRRSGRLCAALLLIPTSVVVGCRAADIDGVTPLPQLLAFLPWLVVPAGAALLLSALARWRLGLLWSVVVLGAVAWFIEPYGKVAEPHGTPVAELRVLTSNIELGQATGPLAAAVRQERPDIVFVEECDRPCAADLDRLLGPDAYPYRSTDPAAGTDGSLILSRFPLRPTGGVAGPLGMPGAVAEVHGHTVRLQLAHPMSPDPGEVGVWRTDLGALRDFAAQATEAGSTILAGDFNSSQDHAAFRRILDTGLRDSARLAGSARTPSWPARTTPAFGVQLDHVLVSRDFSVRGARFLDLPDTDHRSLVVDLTLHRASR